MQGRLSTSEWDSHRAELDELLAAGTALAFIRSEFGRYLTPVAWEQDAAEIKEVLAEAGGRRTRLLSSKYRQARSILSQICVTKAPYEWADQKALLDVVVNAQELCRIIDRHLPLAILRYRQGTSTRTGNQTLRLQPNRQSHERTFGKRHGCAAV